MAISNKDIRDGGHKVYNLPFDLAASGAEGDDEDEVIIRAYSAQCNSNKNRIMLHRNMINLLISGKKTIMRPEGLVTIHEGELVILSCGNSNNEGDLQLRTAVESNVCNPVTAEELAFLCHSSLSTFKRNFRKIYGSSPQKWLLQRKLAVAADLLKHPDQRPGGVYEQVGYENHSSFTQAFKKQYGVTPSAYQECMALQP